MMVKKRYKIFITLKSRLLLLCSLCFFYNFLSAQYEGISNVRNWHFKGLFNNVTHHVEGEYTYSFYSVDADTFFYEDQLKLYLPNKEFSIVLLKLNKQGQVVHHGIFNSVEIENDEKSSVYTEVPIEVISNEGILYFNIRSGGHLYFNSGKIEGNYEKPVGNDFTNNNVIIGLNQDFEIEYSKIFYGYNVTVNSLAFRENEMYILGTFFRDSMNIGSEKIYKPGHVLTTKGYLYVYDVVQDTFVAKSCFAWGANTMSLRKIRFDREGNLKICINHDSHRILLLDTMVYGDFGGGNPIILTLNKGGEVLDIFDGYVSKRLSNYVDAVPTTDGGLIVFGSCFSYNLDSLAIIRQFQSDPIIGKSNSALFIFKINLNKQTEWYRIIELESQLSHGIGDIKQDASQNIYLHINNKELSRIMDKEGNEYESGLNLCKMNPDGHMEYIHHFYDFFTYFYSMDILEENVLSINTFLKFRKNDMEKIFGRQLRHQVDGVIFDFDMTSMFTGIEDEENELKEKIRFFPNPTHKEDVICVYNVKNSEVPFSLYATDGKCVSGGLIINNEFKTPDVKSGIYIIRIYDKNLHHDSILFIK